MFERYTDRARRIVVLAQEQARGLDHNYVGTEHLLLGMLAEGEGVAALSLTDVGIAYEPMHEAIVTIVGRGQQPPDGHIPFTPRAKRVLELGLREALQLGANYIGTEHQLLGLVREGEGVACHALATVEGVTPDVVREAVLTRLGVYEAQRQAAARQQTVETCVCDHVAGHHASFGVASCMWRGCGCPQFIATSLPAGSERAGRTRTATTAHGEQR